MESYRRQAVAMVRGEVNNIKERLMPALHYAALCRSSSGSAAVIYEAAR